MKAQYFGDVNDYRKFALLRLLATHGGFKIGVCWLLTPDEGSKREYLKRPDAWRGFDPALFDDLHRAATERPPSGLQRLERAGTIPGATYFDDPVPGSRTEREAFHSRCMAAFAAVDLVFFDPDNGLATQAHPKGSPTSRKYVFLDEIADHYAAGRSVLVYQHFPRIERRSFLAGLRNSLQGNCEQAAVSIFCTSHVAFVLVAGPEHAERADKVAHSVGERWPSQFMRVDDLAQLADE